MERMKYIFKLLAPEVLASAVIGKGGEVVKGIKEKTGTRISLSSKGEYYPGTQMRQIVVAGPSEEAIMDALRMIFTKLEECASSPLANEELGLKTADELRIHTLVPKSAAGGIIGRSGANIKAMREGTGAKLRVESQVFGTASGTAEQMITVNGTIAQLEAAFCQIVHTVQEDVDQDWFQDWGSTSQYGGGAQGPGSLLSMNGYPGMGPGSQGGLSSRSFNQFQGPQFGRVNHPEAELLMNVVQTLPPQAMSDPRGFALSCVVPNSLVGGLIGKGGSGTKEIQRITNTKIGIRDLEGDTENRSLNITGSLLQTCAAYMLMMKRYIELEQQMAAAGPAGGKGNGKPGKP